MSDTLWLPSNAEVLEICFSRTAKKSLDYDKVVIANSWALGCKRHVAAFVNGNVDIESVQIFAAEDKETLEFMIITELTERKK